MEKLKEKILSLKVDTTQVLRENTDAVYLTEHDTAQILTLFQDWLEKEIGELKVIGDEEIYEAVIKADAEYAKKMDERKQAHIERKKELPDFPAFEQMRRIFIAQAQLDDVNKHFEEMK